MISRKEGLRVADIIVGNERLNPFLSLNYMSNCDALTSLTFVTSKKWEKMTIFEFSKVSAGECRNDAVSLEADISNFRDASNARYCQVG